MKRTYNVTGAERKALVGEISEIMRYASVYKGAPTFAYVVNNLTIDRNGTLTWDERTDDDTIQNLLRKLAERGYSSTTPTAEDEAWAEREMRRMRLENENVPDYSNRGQYGGDDIPETTAGEDESCRLVIEMPLDGFTPEKLDNLAKLVNAKASLLKTALDTDDLPIQQTDNTLRFPWFGDGLDADTVKAYASLVGMICAAAKTKQRVTAREKDPENKKYAMRCWLLSLGFIGDEYRTSRRILLSKLEGNSSFKNGTPQKETESEVG